MSQKTTVKEGESLLRTVLNRLKKIEGVEKDASLAAPLHVEKGRIEQWKFRDSIPWEQLVEYCRRERVSLEWLVNGRGTERVTDMAMEPGGIYRVHTDQDAVYAIAGMIYRALLSEDEEIDVTWEKFVEMVKFVHRDMLDRGETKAPPYERVLQFVKAATP